MLKPCKDIKCERKGELLSLTDFPRNRRLEHGRHLYCRRCCQRRATESRRARGAREYTKRKPMVIVGARDPFAFSKVYDAVCKGCKTREEIRAETQLHFDDIGEALTELVFECKAVRIERVGQQRELVLVA